MRIAEMQLSDREGNIKAFFKVETEEGFVIEGFKVMNGKNGLFASMPSKKVGEKFIDIVTGSRELRTELSNLALSEYKKLAEGGPAVRSAPGRTLPPINDKDLPF
jgi:stage V sporulation protein G